MEFQIYLLTPQTRRNSVYYTKDLMTDFVSQTEQQPHYSYTYNETYKESENSKKSLTFTMTKRVFLNGDWVDNPFVAAAQPNSQILLVDRYGNETIFVITDISYSFSSINVTYSYTCEDFFSYSTIRQNDGYVIENDPESDEFIGSRTLDWWAYKIRKDCNIRYEYIPMREAVYADRKGEIHHSLDIENCKHLIKNAYDEANFKDYYTQTIFSCSGSSANAALVDLASRLDMHVRVYEHLKDTKDGNQLVGYFWFEPKKNDLRDSGLVYSPNTSIQSFGLTHSSKSLTSILNVQGPTYNDELITLIPDITPFFFRYFESKMWLKSDFKENGFTALLQRQTFTGQEYENKPTRMNADETDASLKERLKTWYAGLANVAVNSKIIYYHDVTVENDIITIPLDRLDLFITYSGLYPHFSFKGSLISASDKVYTPQNSEWTLVRSYSKESGFEDREFIEGSILPTEKASEKYEHKLVINCGGGHPGPASYLGITLNLSLYDNFTDEDRKFAKAADKCPWLENKIIDLSYFKKAGIISSAEYRDLLNLLYNKLRIINGRLLCYSKAYYTALHNKTQILAEITNDFDSLGAACQAAIVTPYETKGTVKDITYFNSAYNHAFIATEARPGLMFQISETLTSYFNKYFNAQQRFLKNIYTFRKFWEAPVSIAGDGIYTNTFTLDRPASWNITPEKDMTETYFSFSSTSTAAKNVTTAFAQYNSNKDSAQYGAPLFPIYKRISTANGTDDYQYLPADIASRDNCSKYKIRIDPKPGDLTEVQNGQYNPEKTYYKKVLTVDFPAVIEDTIHKYKYSISLTSINASSIIPTVDTVYKGLWLATKQKLTPEQLEGTTPVATGNDTSLICGIYDIKAVDSSTKQYIFEMQKQLQYNGSINDAIFEAENLLLVPVYLDSNNCAYFVKNAQPIYNMMNGIDLAEGVEAPKKEVIAQKQTLVNILNNVGMVYYEGLKDLYSITSPEIYTDIPTLRKCLDIAYWDTEAKEWKYKENYGRYTIRKILNSAFFNSIADESFKQRLPMAYDEYSYQVNFPSTEFYWNGYRSTFNYNTGEYTFYKKNGVATKDFKELKPEDKQDLPVYFVTKNNVDQFYHLDLNLLYFTVAYSTSPKNTTAQNLKSYMEWIGTGDLTCWTNDAAAACNTDIFGTEIAIFNNYVDTLCLISKGKLTEAQDNEKETPYRYTPLSQGPVAGTLSKYQKQQRNEQKAYADIISERGYTFSTLFETWSAKERGLTNSSSLQVQDSFKFKDSYWVRADEVVQDGEYGLLEVPINPEEEADETDNILWKKALPFIEREKLFETMDGESSSALIYYPLTQRIRAVNFSSLDWKHHDIFTAKQALEAVFNGGVVAVYKTVFDETGAHQVPTPYIDITCFGKTRRFIFLRHWTFKLIPLTLTTQDKIQCRALKTSIIYNNETKRKVNWETEPFAGLCYNFYEAAPTTYEDATPENFALDKIYWNEDTDTQVPTIIQAGQLGGYVYYDFFSYSEESFINHTPSVSLILYKHQRDIKFDDKKNVSIKDTVLDSGTTLQLDLPWNTDTFDMPISVGDQELKLHVQQQTTGQNFKDLTNGTFWYKYKDDTAHALCLSHAAAIEAELTQYWNAAYVASKYCEYYLPENWVEFVNKKNNYTFKRIFSIGDQVELSNDLVPVVHIVTDEKGNTELPRYTWTYESQSARRHEYSQDTWLQTERKNGAEIAKNNDALKNAFVVLNEASSNYCAEESGTTTYYYTDETSGGKTWSQFLQGLTHKDYSQYSGIYVLTYRAIRQGYLDTNIEAYDQAKRDQQQMWHYLYDHYSNVLFEKSYTNSDATTSEELYDAAMNELLDTTIPERSYNMSIIDWHSLKGYDGHELRIGDPIKINADELYSDKDFVYQSLSQLLFISDISYTLRDPSSLSVTVNNVKYSDKLINRLVSLIH